MSNSIADLTSAQLRQAAEIKEKIAALQSELDRLLGGGKTNKTRSTRQSKMTPEARKKIGAAQKKIWAKRKAEAKKSNRSAKSSR